MDLEEQHKLLLVRKMHRVDKLLEYIPQDMLAVLVEQ
jgi:hypothetical protein